MVNDHGMRFGPFSLGEAVDKDFPFDVQFALGMKMTAGIPAKGCDEVVDAFSVGHWLLTENEYGID